MNDEIDWSKAFTKGDIERPAVTQRGPNYDPIISNIVGHPVLATDPRLLKLVVKYKNPKREADNMPDDHLHNTKFLMELKKIFK